VFGRLNLDGVMRAMIEVRSVPGHGIENCAVLKGFVVTEIVFCVRGLAIGHIQRLTSIGRALGLLFWTSAWFSVSPLIVHVRFGTCETSSFCQRTGRLKAMLKPGRGDSKTASGCPWATKCAFLRRNV